MDHSLGVRCDVGAGNEMATVPEETVEFNGADSNGIRNAAALGAAGTCAASDRGDVGEVGAAVPRVRNPVGFIVEPVVEQELSQESGVADAASPVETTCVLYAAGYASCSGLSD